MSVRGFVKGFYYVSGGIQFLNFHAWNDHNLVHQKLPGSLRLPFIVGGSILAAIAWPVSLPMMVAYDALNEKD
jgi:hypothetical protein